MFLKPRQGVMPWLINADHMMKAMPAKKPLMRTYW